MPTAGCFGWLRNFIGLFMFCAVPAKMILLFHISQSAQAHLAESDLIAQFREERLDFVSSTTGY
jgi:hypothetical protein